MSEEAITLYNEGYFYYTGEEEHPLDYCKAFEYFYEAANLSYGPAMNYLGLMYENGLGVEEDLEQAFKWYQNGAEKNDAYSLFNLGRWYSEGIGVQKNDDVAMQYFRRSLEIESIPDAAYYYGCYCLEQDDPETAVRMFEYAANNLNIPEAWHNLGWAIMQGGGSFERESQNAARQAAPFYKQAAEMGYVPSMDEYGRILIKIQGNGQIPYEAQRWIKRAADEGYEPAIKKLKISNIWNFFNKF